MCAAVSPTSNTEQQQQQSEEKKNSMDSTNSFFTQPAFLRSFEAELDKVDEYFQSKAPDVRQAILDSLQRMYNQNEWHDNPLTIICRDLDIPIPTAEQLMELKLTRDALKAEYDALRQSIDH